MPVTSTSKTCMRCGPSRASLHRVGSSPLKACPDLESIELPESTSLVVQDCPRLMKIRGKVTGDLTVEDCSELAGLDIILPKDALPAPSVVVRRCAKLESIGRVSGIPRVCMDLIVEDCTILKVIWPSADRA